MKCLHASGCYTARSTSGLSDEKLDEMVESKDSILAQDVRMYFHFSGICSISFLVTLLDTY